MFIINEGGSGDRSVKCYIEACGADLSLNSPNGKSRVVRMSERVLQNRHADLCALIRLKRSRYQLRQ